jgi:hypothetical protein
LSKAHLGKSLTSKNRPIFINFLLSIINRIGLPQYQPPNKCIHNLSEHILTDAEEAVLMKGLNFSVTYPHPNLDMACAVESVVSKLPQPLGLEFRWKIIKKSISITGRYYMSSQIFPPLHCIGAHALGFVGYVYSTNFYLLFHLISTHVRALSKFLLYTSLLPRTELAWSQVIK